MEEGTIERQGDGWMEQKEIENTMRRKGVTLEKKNLVDGRRENK